MSSGGWRMLRAAPPMIDVMAGEAQAEALWAPPPRELHLGPEDRHVWRGCLAETRTGLERLAAGLSREETGRAARFIRAEHGERYVFAHGMLRRVLAAYAGCPPQALVFAATPRGKPYLVAPDAARGLHFNLSHSRDLALVALAREPVGVDLEYVLRRADMAGIAARFFSPDERRWLDTQPRESYRAAFFACWTAKEAYIKGIGEGLAHPLEGFSVVFDAGGRSARIREAGATALFSGWSLRAFQPAPDYCGAIAARGFRKEPALIAFPSWAGEGDGSR